MKAFVQFYTPSTGWNGTDYTGPKNLVPALGSDGYKQLDGRLAVRNLHYHAGQLTRVHFRKEVCGYKLFRGDLVNNRGISKLIEVKR